MGHWKDVNTLNKIKLLTKRSMIQLNNINWKIRFTKKNLSFIFRFIGALLVPVLAYYGITYDDLNTWPAIGDFIISFVSNPFLIALTIGNAINMIPDNTTPGIKDSEKALGYETPGGKK